ncbi:MAG: hypothetical protein GEU89_21115, partial [Kiloniellaceae bacterium]|nr:hypothetical protein [Kiloniellaceae bacterium]
GRIEYALAGGRMNTDYIDNSAGVDTSDHEVNIKILLDSVVRDGELGEAQRSQLLVDMTDEVAELTSTRTVPRRWRARSRARWQQGGHSR